jgi:hypothetical protein
VLTYAAVHTFSLLVSFASRLAGCERRGRLGTARVPQLGGARGERAWSNPGAGCLIDVVAEKQGACR